MEQQFTTCVHLAEKIGELVDERVPVCYYPCEDCFIYIILFVSVLPPLPETVYSCVLVFVLFYRTFCTQHTTQEDGV